MALCSDSESTCVKQLKIIGDFYDKHLKGPVTQKQMFYNKVLTRDIYDMYNEVFRGRYDALPSFSHTNPNTNRFYQMYPNKGEHKDLDPTYGITVLASTNEDDNEYTLVGLLNEGARNPYGRSNLHINKNALNHWLSRANYDEGVKQVIKRDINSKEMTLQNIILFFKNMGFKNILIWDTSCRVGDLNRSASFSVLSKKEKISQPEDTPIKITRYESDEEIK